MEYEWTRDGPNWVLCGLLLTLVQSHVYTRSQVTVSDEGSKLGTTVDGEQIKGKSKKLTGTEHSVKMGKYSPLR